MIIGYVNVNKKLSALVKNVRMHRGSHTNTFWLQLRWHYYQDRRNKTTSIEEVVKIYILQEGSIRRLKIKKQMMT